MNKNLNNDHLKARVAHLESQLDFLETELTGLNSLLVEVGFPEGIRTLRMTAEELLAESHQEHFKGF